MMNWNMSEEVAELFQVAEKELLWPGLELSSAAVLHRSDVESLIPHREPFLFIDDVFCLDLDKGLVATRYDLEKARFFLAGHYPGNPFWPAVFQIEAIAQSGGLLFNYKYKAEGAPALLTHVLGARFRLPVKPGADTYVVARILDDGMMIEVVGQCLQNGEICSAAALKFYTLAEE